MLPMQYIWLIWSSAFLIPWVTLFFLFPRQRREMWWASIFTTPLGLTEPLFVPAYWDPPSLFGLAQKTGFDIESLIFSFAIGGVAAVLYNILSRKRAQSVSKGEKRKPLHRHHYLALSTPFITFVLLFFLPWNHIYPAIVAMLAGAVASLLCRPDLKVKIWIGGGLFLLYYILFLQAIALTSPMYIEQVWNLKALTGILIVGMPVEELLFAIGFGMYWSSVYEHFTWRGVVHNE